ncbi:MAG: protein-L-isoaspartate(D-aspartate) O-methyltransferase [Dehalococcoidia bacterium]|nr:protein-L-isoaspartate(D-aspartate) O-methyltransferase [Dehalococcoidia bacterium]
MERDRRDLFRSLRRKIGDERVIAGMERVPREAFVPSESRYLAYKDIALSIGQEQTISQPYIVALMTSCLGLQGSERVLEVGTGSGYQAAVLSHLVPRGHVLTVERIPALAERARVELLRLGCDNVEVRVDRHVLGCPDRGPFDAIIVTAAAPALPYTLMDQMATGGRMVIPVGTRLQQELVRVLRTDEGPSVSLLGPCRFVPLIGPDAWPEE